VATFGTKTQSSRATASTLVFSARTPDPRHVSIQTMRRDETMRRDGATKTEDTVSIILDTYGDRLTGYFFHAERSDRS
jgi:hypothetical protein